MSDDKTSASVLSANGVSVEGSKGYPNGICGDRIQERDVFLPSPRTPYELIMFINNYIRMIRDIKGLTTVGKDVLLAADDMLTGAQGTIRKAISEIKRREEGQMQLHFSVRNAFYGVVKTFGEDSNSILTEARAVALTVGKQLNLPDIEKYVNSLENEYKSGAKKQVSSANAASESTAKYRITIDGKIVSEKCRRNNMELARILYKHGITDGEKSDDCKALGIDITDTNAVNEAAEYRIKRKHLKIERIN